MIILHVGGRVHVNLIKSENNTFLEGYRTHTSNSLSRIIMNCTQKYPTIPREALRDDPETIPAAASGRPIKEVNRRSLKRDGSLSTRIFIGRLSSRDSCSFGQHACSDPKRSTR